MKILKEYFPLIVSVIVIAVISFVAMPVMAQTKVEKWPAFYDCGPMVLLEKLLDENREVPIVESIGVLQIPGDTTSEPPQMIQAPIIQYYNSKTGTYTIIADFENGYSCILLFGHGIKAAGGVKTNLQKDEWKEKLKEPEKVNPEDIKKIDSDQEFLVYLTKGLS